ncbi:MULTISPECIES: glycosyltransferase [unclassified Pedobacter]|uniref:glycosyltransferase n=1 Tax=unclassified Pedobacter TaxID=2628915 RepID=UPI001E591B07|nr:MULTISPECIES: glycosyltransferase [unclassified Pedobacter]
MVNRHFSGSIVLFKNEYNEVKKAILSFIQRSSYTSLYLIDNSPDDRLKNLKDIGERIVYIHNPHNPGFGSSHNVAIEMSISKGNQFHFIINPDIHFDDNVVETMIDFMGNDQSIGMMMPKVLNENGSLQNLPKLLPTPMSIVWRKLGAPRIFYSNFINKYELRFVPTDRIYNAPVLSGCFTLLNLAAIKEVGMYDDRFFMYFEDWDLSRRMHARYKTVYFPTVSVYHGYESGANKSAKLFKIFLNSAFSYFNKWGWLFDKERGEINSNALKQFR